MSINFSRDAGQGGGGDGGGGTYEHILTKCFFNYVFLLYFPGVGGCKVCYVGVIGV